MLLTVKETSKILKTNVDYIYKIIKAGLLPTIKLGSIKVRSESLQEFIKTYEGYDLSDPYNPVKIKENDSEFK